MDNGSLAETTNSTISGTICWTGDPLAGTLPLTANGALNIFGGADHDLPNFTFTNNGTAARSGRRIRGGGSPGTFIYNSKRRHVVPFESRTGFAC